MGTFATVTSLVVQGSKSPSAPVRARDSSLSRSVSCRRWPERYVAACEVCVARGLWGDGRELRPRDLGRVRSLCRSSIVDARSLKPMSGDHENQLWADMVHVVGSWRDGATLVELGERDGLECLDGRVTQDDDDDMRHLLDGLALGNGAPVWVSLPDGGKWSGLGHRTRGFVAWLDGDTLRALMVSEARQGGDAWVVDPLSLVIGDATLVSEAIDAEAERRVEHDRPKDLWLVWLAEDLRPVTRALMACGRRGTDVTYAPRLPSLFAPVDVTRDRTRMVVRSPRRG